jgi:hypothetical protein
MIIFAIIKASSNLEVGLGVSMTMRREGVENQAGSKSVGRKSRKQRQHPRFWMERGARTSRDFSYVYMVIARALERTQLKFS